MPIDRSNYEIWIIDWLDGNLNSFQIDQVKVFLDHNPDLKEEVNELTGEELIPPAASFPNKESLKKSPEEMSPSQFEYLCAAYLENDLTVSQQAELREIINIYPEKKKTFDLIQKTILSPDGTTFRHKSSLLKRTPFQKVIRITVMGMGAAAAISAFIIVRSVLQSADSSKLNSSARNLEPDTVLHRADQVIPAERINNNVPLHAGKAKVNMAATAGNEQNLTRNNVRIIPSDDPLLRNTTTRQMAVNKVPVNANVDLGKGIVSNTLVASNSTVNPHGSDEERSRIGRFVTKTVREKLLQEETPSDSPIRGLEIAEAGVSGINKLLGWEMALDVKNDETGRPKSVRFNSQILKFSTPVKKRETER